MCQNTHTHTRVCVSWYPHAQHYYNKHACAITHTHTHTHTHKQIIFQRRKNRLISQHLPRLFSLRQILDHLVPTSTWRPDDHMLQTTSHFFMSRASWVCHFRSLRAVSSGNSLQQTCAHELTGWLSCTVSMGCHQLSADTAPVTTLNYSIAYLNVAVIINFMAYLRRSDYVA